MIKLLLKYLFINFLIISWRGYSGNLGKPSELGLYKDAEGALEWLNKKGIPLTITIHANAITVAELADDAVTTAKILNDNVTGGKLSNDVAISTTGSVTTTGSGTLTVAGTSTLTGNATASGNLTVSGDIVPSTPLSHRNMVINGDMVVSQRTGTTETTPGNAVYMTDRWRSGLGQASKFKYNQTTTVPDDFTNSLLLTSLSAYTPTGNDHFFMEQPIEGYITKQCAFGTSSAKSITLSFYVRSSLTGTFGGAISNNARNRSYTFAYTISSANTWERKTITIPGAPNGTWGTGNNEGMIISLIAALVNRSTNFP